MYVQQERGIDFDRVLAVLADPPRMSGSTRRDCFLGSSTGHDLDKNDS